MSNIVFDLFEYKLIKLKRVLYKHRNEIIEDLQLDGAISCPECIIGNSESFCFNYCSGCCECNHNECDNCDMTCHSYPKLNIKNNKCYCNCDHSRCNKNDNIENKLYCDGRCHELCKYLHGIEGDKVVIAMLLKKAQTINDKIFEKYNNLFNLNDNYFIKPYKLKLSQYYTDQI